MVVLGGTKGLGNILSGVAKHEKEAIEISNNYKEIEVIRTKLAANEQPTILCELLCNSWKCKPKRAIMVFP